MNLQFFYYLIHVNDSCIRCLPDIHIFSLRDRAQVEQLLRYVIEEPSEDADSKHAFKYDPLPRQKRSDAHYELSIFLH